MTDRPSVNTTPEPQITVPRLTKFVWGMVSCLCLIAIPAIDVVEPPGSGGFAYSLLCVWAASVLTLVIVIDVVLTVTGVYRTCREVIIRSVSVSAFGVIAIWVEVSFMID